ncbi:hypothetical protein KJ781_01765 [Patescibacteria group bacterium]|nr:hypothetical protein [Patescibacteria group bacterium]MBU1448322.1 hypothetical protein [Patescibacteria group bacterium]
MTTDPQAAQERVSAPFERMPSPESTPPESSERLVTRGREEVGRLTVEMKTAQASLAPEDDVFSGDFWDLKARVETAQAELEKDIGSIISETLHEQEQLAEPTEASSETPPLIDPNLDPLEMSDRIRDVLAESTERHVAFDKLDQVAELASKDASIREQAMDRLSDVVGKKFAERILSDRRYREVLHRLQETLTQRISGKESPNFCKETGLENLGAIHEVLGERAEAVVRTLDLRSYGRGLDASLKFSPSQNGEFPDAIRVFGTSFDDEGNLTDVQIDLGFGFDVIGKDGTATGDDAKIYRSFILEQRTIPDGTMEKDITVKHELFELPTSIKGNGLAAEVTATSLQEYDRIGANAITLHANIEQGGYAWAGYGYGWDQRKTREQDVGGLIGGVKAAFLDALQEAGVDPSSEAAHRTIEAIETAEQNPSACTPQHLALLGKEELLFRRGTSGRLYTDEAFQAALAEGSETDEMDTMKGPLHAGKLGMMGSSWYGRIDLKPDGPQGGKNRALLEEKVSRSTK